ncbi:MAG: transposase, partial [Bacteroidetes bacterium]|nr:transposase [Bacteroidota bacterium]
MVKTICKCRTGGRFAVSLSALSKVFRARFVEYLRKEMDLPGDLYIDIFSKQWVVYCKRPFWGPQHVVEYLGRYTHKIAISNHRIRDIQCDKVIFMAKDYRHGGKTHPVTLSQQEFIRR